MDVLLASPAGAAITGQVISVDGGFKVRVGLPLGFGSVSCAT